MCFLVPLLSKVSSKPDGVIVTGSTDNAALHPVTNKNNNRMYNFKNLQNLFKKHLWRRLFLNAQASSFQQLY